MKYKEYERLIAEEKRKQEIYSTMMIVVPILMFFIGRVIWS
jgi:hypothetical protein